MGNVPNFYSEYVDETADPRFTDWLRKLSEPNWSNAVNHEFTHDLGSGTLKEDVFKEYLIQDYTFFKTLLDTFGFAVAQAPDIDSKRPLVEFLETVTDEENDYFERSFEALDVPESRQKDPDLKETTATFMDLLYRASRQGGYVETLSVIVPAEWIYKEWATAVSDSTDTNTDSLPSSGLDLPFYYAEWIDLHAVPSFIEFVNWLREQLDEYGPKLSPERQDRVVKLFQRTVKLEVDFFDSAYKRE